MDFHNHPVRSVLRVIGAFFFFLFCFLLLGPGGANWTGFPNFLCSLALALIFALKSPKWGAIIGAVVIAGAMYLTPAFEPLVAEEGLNADTITRIILGTLEVFILVVAIPGSIIHMIIKDRRTVQDRKEKNAAAGVPCCPNCGATMIAFVQPRSETQYREYTDKWGNRQQEAYTTDHIPGHWRCGNCGHTWN